jgi:hypothetical protein
MLPDAGARLNDTNAYVRMPLFGLAADARAANKAGTEAAATEPAPAFLRKPFLSI